MGQVEALDGARAKSSLKAKVLKTTASEGLSLLPVIAHFCIKGLCQHADAKVRNHGRCMVLLWRIVRLILLMNTPGARPTPWNF